MSNHFIAQQWIDGDGVPLVARDPSKDEPIFNGAGATAADVDAAVAAARNAFELWSNLPSGQRVALVQKFADALLARRASLALSISRSTGKPLWESNAEVETMIRKISVSVTAHQRRRSEQRHAEPNAVGVTRYRPLGVMAVLGPFNFPGHLPNGHIVPALLEGNTVVFKPSERAPLAARETMLAWEALGLPPGVINMIQGDGAVGAALAGHPDIDGVAFTGSFAVGQALSRILADRPQVMLALEMGGNSPLVVWDVDDTLKVAYWIAQSAYITAGQRCSCARRLIVRSNAEGDEVVRALADLIPRLRVGKYSDEPAPFMGPLISQQAANAVIRRQEDLLARGAKPIVASRQWNRTFVSPGLIDVTAVRATDDTEIFGPLLTVTRVADFDAAIAEANRTHYGLAAGLYSKRRDLFEQFIRRVRAGVVNFNRPLTGASSNLPFGGLGRSGNHRPSAYHAADYCSDAVASLEADSLSAVPPDPIGIEPPGNATEGRH